MHASPDNLGNSQDKILYQIKRLGPLVAKELAHQLDITTMAIRQHLAQLEALQLIAALPEEPAAGRGRPVRRWKLTEKGHQRFPDSHAQITSELIISIREVLGEAAIDQIIDKRTEQTFTHYQQQLAKVDTLAEKLDLLCELRSREGYMAEIEQQGTAYLLIEHHCPICIAAKSCLGFCNSELEVFQKLFETIATVNRQDHILSGARRCTYRVEPIL